MTHLWDIPHKQDVTICVIDTGYELGHPDLPANPEYNVTGWDPTTGTYASGLWYVDGHGHGTHCAGTIGAIGNNDVGVIGVNPDPTRFRFHIGKGLSDGGSGLSSDVLLAVDDCIANGARVISMSLGSSSYSATADATYQEAYEAGVLVIAAAGNTANSNMHYPASYQQVMSVASIQEGGGGSLSGFSTHNDQTEIAAPGRYVSAVLDTRPTFMNPYFLHNDICHFLTSKIFLSFPFTSIST